MKILTVTFNKAQNYGAQLQEYALMYSLNMKHDTKVLNYLDQKMIRNYQYNKIKGENIFEKIKCIIRVIIHFNKNNKRNHSFIEYENENIKYSEKEYTLNQIKNECFSTSVLIAGSDQVWNPEITDGLSDVYTLNFGNDNIKRISYAASVGNEKNIQKYKEEYKKKLSRLDRISVREESAKKELEKILPGKKIEVVLDPTLLLKKEEWESKINNIKSEKEKYILAYYVDEDKNFVNITNELSKTTGLKVIHFDKRNRGLKNVLRSAYTDGPLEFIKLIKNAEYIVATSFHATVFSIIFNKKFWIVPHKTTGSRVTDLLKKLGISNRAINSIDEFKEKDYNEEIDYEKVNKLLEKERQKSIDWLMDAIEK